MSDRYLFRAKRCDTGEWVEGSLITGVFFREERLFIGAKFYGMSVKRDSM